MKSTRRLITLFVFIIFNTIFTFGQKTKNQMRVIYYENALKDTSCSDANRILFFKAFPSSFKELNEVYGWDDKNNVRRELNKFAEQHLELFGKTYDCFPKQWTLKSIKIALNGKWDADAVNYFKRLLGEKLHKNPKLYFNYLSKFTDKENISFWKFLIDNPFKNNDMISKFEKIAKQDSVQSKYFKAAIRSKWGK